MEAAEIALDRLYDDLAFLMALISPPEEYAEESGHWRTVLREKLGPGRHSLLELGVGGGHNLSHLAPEFDATAVDISEAMLAHCRRLNPDVTLHQGDMKNVRLGRKFCAVLIHDAISYMLTEEDLAATFETAAAHLEKGGIFITSPDHFLETFSSPDIEHATHQQDQTEVAYFQYSHHLVGSDTIVESIMTYMIRAEGRLRIEHDRHLTGLFPKATWLHLMNGAGFSTEVKSFPLQGLERPYELLVGTFR
jgi:SAM-dependent methyltransferase